ncbi:4'-phosphopantetheinyl transferase [Aphelenchoides bicaudatus]|nr:4'-phosphopantetheinyl transferase [Aphelenchoides bicaudatus]
MNRVLSALLLCIVASAVYAEVNLDEKQKAPLDSARILGSKTPLSQYAIEGMDFVFEYKLFNVGDRTATKVSLDDRASFPTQAFEIVKGLLQVRWEKIPPGGNVTHSVVVRPRSYGVFNHTAAQITYYPKDDSKEVRQGYTTAPGESSVYRLRDYERLYTSKWSVWVVFFLLTIPSTVLPFAIWWQLRNKRSMSTNDEGTLASGVKSMNIQQLQKCVCNRWAFSLQKAFTNDNLEYYYRRAIQAVTEEDYQKIISFRHKDDSLACLAGRLFLRQAVCKLTGASWADVKIERTEKGKPFIVQPEGFDIGLNASHQGDYTVFATSCSSKVGVDVMRLDMCRGNKTADEYINSMAKSASVDELKNMRGQATEQMKMTVFYRYWCLKEALLKATGQGIVEDLSRYDFRIVPSERYRQGAFLTSTTVLEDGKLMPQWILEESFVDSNHVGAVCREKKMPRCCSYSKDPDHKIFFSQVNFDFLLEGSTPLNFLPNDAAEEYTNFMEKPRKKF